MRVPSRVALAVVLPVLSLALAGCFEIKEDLTIDKDGSGKLTIDIAMDMAGATQTPENKAKDEEKRKKKKEDLEKDPNVTKVEIKTYDEGTMSHETTEVSVKDVTKLPATLAKLKQGSGKDEDLFTVKKLQNGNFEVYQTLGKKTKPAAPASDDEKKQAETIKAQMVKKMGEHKFTLKIHGPSIVSTNGKTEGNTAVFEVKLAKLMSDDTGKGEEFKAEVGAK